MAPMTRPLMVRGAEAANMCSPVLGSEPIHTWVLPSLRALAISGVPGERKAVKSELEKKYSPQQLNAQKIKKVLENDPSAQYQLRMYGKNEYIDGHSAFDRLDENRCSGFLLYSYNKKGVHSVLGEHITPGSTRQKENKRGKLWIQST